MTIEKLQARLQTLQNDSNQTQANLHALGGAIQDVQYWIQELDKEAKEKEDRAAFIAER
jgi:uncharacterized protein YoxC